MEKEKITQATMLQWFLPILREEGKSFCKTQQVLARKAMEGLLAHVAPSSDFIEEPVALTAKAS